MRFIAHLMHHACSKLGRVLQQQYCSSKLGRVDKSGISRVFCRAQIDAHIAMHILPIAMHGECLRRAPSKNIHKYLWKSSSPSIIIKRRRCFQGFFLSPPEAALVCGTIRTWANVGAHTDRHNCSSYHQMSRHVETTLFPPPPPAER